VLHEAGGLALSDHPVGAGSAEREVEVFVAGAPPEPEREARPAPEPSARRSPDAQAVSALRAEIDSRYEKLGGLDHYELLGVAPRADAAAIKAAYHRAAKTYHPDALARAGLDAETRRRANRIFAEIGKAQAVLADPGRRRDYDASLGNDGEVLDAGRLASAETNFRKGEILVRQGNFRAAVDYLRAAVELWPDEPAYQSALGWALFKKTPSEPRAAREHLERAIALDARDPVLVSRLGAIVRELEVRGSGTT
jgi:tetratricopeptide (TPR) repeat protein